MRGLFLEGLIFRGAYYVWREICVSNSVGLAYRGLIFRGAM